MYIELMEIDKNNNNIGEFIINTNDIIFVDTVNIEAGQCKRIKLKNSDIQFYIRDKDYERIKNITLKEIEYVEKM